MTRWARHGAGTALATCIVAACVAGAPVLPSAHGQQVPAEILKAAYAKLQETTYRVKRYPPEAAARPYIADVVPPGLARATFTMRVVPLGDIRFEEVSLRHRRGERIVAPSPDVLAAQVRAASSVAPARDLLTSVLTGLLSAARAGYYAVGPLAESFDSIARTVRLASDLPVLVSQADVLVGTLNRWMCGGNLPGTSLSIVLPTTDTASGPALVRGVAATKYVREVRLSEGSPSRMVVYIENASGLPIREEALDDRGRVTWVTEYIDFGASISIDTPDCLTPRGPRER